MNVLPFALSCRCDVARDFKSLLSDLSAIMSYNLESEAKKVLVHLSCILSEGFITVTEMK